MWSTTQLGCINLCLETPDVIASTLFVDFCGNILCILLVLSPFFALGLFFCDLVFPNIIALNSYGIIDNFRMTF